MNLQGLSAPFDPAAIHWRAQTVTKDGAKALALAYLDARDVMERLDEVCGPAGWSTYNEETPRGRVLCKLSILVEGEWVTKTDGAGDTAVEGEKGGISDALKRAAVQWGVGRYLYDLNSVWAPCESRDNQQRKQFVRWKPEAEAVFQKALRQLRPTGPITDNTRDWIGAQLQAVGCTPQDLLRALQPESLKSLTYADIPAIQNFINSNKKEAA
jgi:hypothetical protein